MSISTLIKLTNINFLNYNHILSSPTLAGCSVKRYLAGLDVGRQLEREGFVRDEKMLKAFFTNYTKSPYVPNTNKRRISQVPNYREPDLLKAMRKSLNAGK